MECGFLSNRAEEELLLQESYRRRVAKAVAQGICDWAALEMEKPQPLAAVDRSGEATGE